MEVTSRTEAEYLETISSVIEYIQAHLDDDLAPNKLAEVAYFSLHHFHRVFRSIVGESAMEHVRRIRLERAAYRLKTSPEPIWTVAYDSGYGSQEAFTRVFQAYFGLAPSQFRRSHASHLLPAPCGVHYRKFEFFPLRAVDPDLFAADQLCAFHSRDPIEDRGAWQDVHDILGGFASLIYPPHYLTPRESNQEHTMSTISTDHLKEIDLIMADIEAAKQRLVEARKKMPKEEVKDYVFKDSEGKDVKLSELFGDKKDLIVVHNMGTGCIYCTMWADGFTGLLPHLMDRAAFALSSPDKPEVQKRFAEKRNWQFKMISAHDNDFFQEMGFWQHEGPHPGPWPGVSTFQMGADGKIYRVAKASFGPGDDFCPTWPFLDMLSDGANGWEPKYSYGGN